MELLGHLWLAIVVAAVLVFIASAAIWMAGPHRKKEFEAFGDEAGVLAALRKSNPAAGAFLIPLLSHAMPKEKAAMGAHKEKGPGGPGRITVVFPKRPIGGRKEIGQLCVFLLV